MAVQYENTPVDVKRVYFTGTDTLYEGYALCYDWDSGTASAIDANRRTNVEKPATANLGHFAGVVHPGCGGRTGPGWLDVITAGPCNVYTDESCVIGVTRLAPKNASYAMAAWSGGVAEAIALQTINRITPGLVSAQLEQVPIGLKADMAVCYDAASLVAAVAASTSTNNKIVLMPGTYTLPATLEMPAFKMVMVGMGGREAVEINAAVAVSPLVNIAPTSLPGTTEYIFRGIYVNHSESAQVGIQVDNTNAGRRIILEPTDCTFECGGNSIDVDHDGASRSVRIYAKDCYFEGAINFDVGEADDRIRFKDCQLIGGLVTGADATACEILLEGCRVLHEGISGGNAAQKINAIATVSDDDAGTYAPLDSSDCTGSHTENLVVFS